LSENFRLEVGRDDNYGLYTYDGDFDEQKKEDNEGNYDSGNDDQNGGVQTRKEKYDCDMGAMMMIM
jgi:hypothetical protein